MMLMIACHTPLTYKTEFLKNHFFPLKTVCIFFPLWSIIWLLSYQARGWQKVILGCLMCIWICCHLNAPSPAVVHCKVLDFLKFKDSTSYDLHRNYPSKRYGNSFRSCIRKCLIGLERWLISKSTCSSSRGPNSLHPHSGPQSLITPDPLLASSATRHAHGTQRHSDQTPINIKQ